ncbi:MAG: acylase [Candidatus Omnitrophica bacterium]|nr:acylase [Candidatus Omnitrophota bacterium]
MKKKIFVILVLLFIGGGVYQVIHAEKRVRVEAVAKASRYDSRILRDVWGVPHVYGKTDADAAFALGYANAEDDYATIQEGLLMVRGELASVKGEEGAVTDYLIKLLKTRELIDAKYDTDLSKETRAICEAYADGVNLYAAIHPEEMAHGVLPFTGKDVVAGFVFKGPFFYGLDNKIQELFGDKRKREVSQKVAKANPFNPYTQGFPIGSNAFAIAPSRTPDGKTHLAINSHQPWEGPVAWYEAHITSEEGWNTFGASFPGCPVILVGHNPSLGWAHTVNSPDLVDIYVLEMNPDNPNQYKYDGEWRDLEVRQVGIKVKLWGPISWTFKREALMSVYGPTVRRDHGVYSIRYGGMQDIRQVEQWYRMNKAQNLEEFMDAMKMRAIPSLNCVYGDREGNIFYLYNARFPKRAEGYDWEKYLPGNTSETLWKEYLPFSALPLVVNPESGFVISCNNTPYRCTLGEDNPKPENFSKTLGIETHMTNRALRALELYGGDESITTEEFYDYKYDLFYSEDSEVAEAARMIASVTDAEDPLVREGIELIRKWNLGTELDNRSTAIALLAINPNPDGGYRTKGLEQMLNNIKKYGAILKRFHGRMDPTWGEVNRIVRGDVDLPIDGGPDVLRAVYSIFNVDGRLNRFEDDGRLDGKGGDCHIQMVTWDEEGRVDSQTIHQYGSATLDKTSPHYADQVEMFAKHEMRPVWFTEAEVREHLESEYRPGEERP